MHGASACVQFCKEEVPSLLRLNRCIRDEVHGKIARYGRVNYLWHGAKRVPVAFVPFGVSAVNFLGLSKLVANILRDTGMFKDAETKKAGARVRVVPSVDITVPAALLYLTSDK